MYSSCPSVCPSVVRLSVLSFCCPFRPISRGEISLYLVGGGGFEETCHKCSTYG